MARVRQHRTVWIVAAVSLAVSLASEASAQGTRRVDIRQPTLGGALAEFARELGVEVLLEPTMVRNLRASPVVGRMSATAALGALLQGSGLGFRTAEPGVYVLQRLPPARDPGTTDGAVAEILVVGRRTQNADIRRAENDVQPYRIISARDLQVSQRGTIDEYLRGRESADVSVRAPLQDTVRQPARTTSEIDLRGLGAERTLVLVDGRRLPGLPTGTIDFAQSDLNGIPIGAVERIEVLTSTAGGIHGPGAVGGVVNVIMRRDYRGADLHITAGVTSRGDAGAGRIEGRLGFTPDGGDTDVMIFAGLSANQPLRAGERDYDLRARARRLRNDPDALLATSPTGAGVGVYATRPLSLDSSLGGGSLGTTYTFLPLTFSGGPAERAAVLAANAGKLPPGLAADAAGARRYLTSEPEASSALMTIRRRFGARVEVYLDGLYVENRGTLVTAAKPIVFATAADAPGNPFAQVVTFSFPLPGVSETAWQDAIVHRLTAGAVFELSPSWRASADVTIGRARLRTGSDGVAVRLIDFASAVSGSPPPGKPALLPLDTVQFQANVGAYLEPQSLRSSLVNRFQDMTLRVAGPGPALPGGPMTLTLLAEHRREDVPVSQTRIDAGSGIVLAFDNPPRRQIVSSAYVEMRAPLSNESHAFPLLRDAELQLAVRHDRTTLRFDDDPLDGSNTVLGGATRRGVTVYTVGGKVRPLPLLLLRASAATGELPPAIRDLLSRTATLTTPQAGVVDPMRSGRLVGAEGAVTVMSGGSRRIRGERGRTLAAGLVINPDAEQAPRISLDYSRIDRTREVTGFPLTLAGLLSATDYAGRIERAPLTEADRQAGFAAGRIIRVDTTALETGRTRSESLDAQLDWATSLGPRGDLRLYARATWQTELRRRGRPDQPWKSYVGYADGPLAWRGNAGATWSRGPFAVDLNVQHFPGYRVAGADTSAADAAFLARNQGSTRVSARTYLDLAATWRVSAHSAPGLRDLEIRGGIVNLFDQAPATIVNPSGPTYAPYGDPRRRRFEVNLTGRF